MGSTRFDVAVLDETYTQTTGEDGLSGTEVARRVRRHEAAAAAAARSRGDEPPRRVRIIGYTGHASQEWMQLALEAGQDHVWGKPLPAPGALAADLAKVLREDEGAGGVSG